MRRDDIAFNSPGDYASTFIELIFPDKKNKIVGCVYRHPSSFLSIVDFSKLCIEPVLQKSFAKMMCCLTGDFNINILKTNQHRA